jgi:S1-C subfamily serine protease
MSRELLNKLLMNPYDELSKVRLVPAFAASGDASGGGQGMRVQNIGNDSLLAQLGVREGDVIQSLNGVPIRNMADVSNAINSLLGGSRMDVSVLREGKSEDLPYAVR